MPKAMWTKTFGTCLWKTWHDFQLWLTIVLASTIRIDLPGPFFGRQWKTLSCYANASSIDLYPNNESAIEINETILTNWWPILQLKLAKILRGLSGPLKDLASWTSSTWAKRADRSVQNPPHPAQYGNFHGQDCKGHPGYFWIQGPGAGRQLSGSEQPNTTQLQG